MPFVGASFVGTTRTPAVPGRRVPAPVRPLVTLLLLITLATLSGCSWGGQARTPVAPASSGDRPSAGPQNPPTAAMQKVADRLVQSIQDADRQAYDRLVSERDPGFAPTAERIFSNLTELAPRDLSITLTGRAADLTAPRRQVLEDEAYAMQAQVSWRLSGERAAADQLVTMTFVSDPTGGYRLAGTTDDAAGETSRQPLWWFEAVRVARQGSITVISSRAVDPGPWLSRAVRAARAVAAQRNTELPPLVLVVPGSGRASERVVGGRIDDQIGALTWADGSETAEAPCRIVINPAGVKGVGDLGLDFLLAHEAVHAATASPASPAPIWVIEGYADLIATRAYPQAQDVAAESLLAEVRQHGAPQQLPADAAFGGSAPELAQSYAEAWFAFRYLVDAHSMAAASEFYDELGSRYNGDLERAMPALLDQSVAEFTQGWRSDLERRAG